MKRRLAVLLFALAGLLVPTFVMNGPAAPTASAHGVVQCTQRWTNGVYHTYWLSICHNHEIDWGWFDVQAYRYPLGGGGVIDNQVNIWMRDSACATYENDGNPLIVFRDMQGIYREMCSPPDRLSSESVNEVDLPNTQVYGYWCYFSCSLTTVNGSVAYGYYAPLNRTSYPDPRITLL